MNDYYYTRTPQSESRPAECTVAYRGRELTFLTDAGVFSRGALDEGTRILLEALPQDLRGDILDLGCGWGPIGICVRACFPDTTVTMADVNERALALSRENAALNGAEVTCVESDGMAALQGRRFDTVITNPPIRAGKQVMYRMLEEAVESLREGGSLYLVIRKQQGAESCIRHLETVCRKVEKLDRSKGYWVLRADR